MFDRCVTLIINYEEQIILLEANKRNRTIGRIRWNVSVDKAYFINNKEAGFGIYLYNRLAATLLKIK